MASKIGTPRSINRDPSLWIPEATKREIVRLLGPRAVPNLEWLSNVTGRSMSAILSAVREAIDLIELEESIVHALERSGRSNYAQFPAPLDLYVITRLGRPRHAVESGVSSGLSSAYILKALQRNGHGTLHSIDFPRYQKAEKRIRGEASWSIPPGLDSGWGIPASLRRGWNLRQGRSEDLLPRLLDELPAVDLFCHDSPWTPAHLSFEFETIRPKLRSGSIVVADNADVNPEAARTLAAACSATVWHRGSSSGLVGIRVP